MTDERFRLVVTIVMAVALALSGIENAHLISQLKEDSVLLKQQGKLIQEADRAIRKQGETLDLCMGTLGTQDKAIRGQNGAIKHQQALIGQCLVLRAPGTGTCLVAGCATAPIAIEPR